MKQIKNVLIAICILLFSSGFFFLDAETNFRTVAPVNESEKNTQDIIQLSTYEEAARYKLERLFGGYPYLLDEMSVSDYLNQYFDEPILTQLISFFNDTKEEEIGQQIKQYLTFVPKQQPEMISLSNEEAVLVWPEGKEGLFVTMNRDKQFWKVSRVELNSVNILRNKRYINHRSLKE